MSKRNKCQGETKEDLLDCMTYKQEKPLEVYKINDKYILAVYQGSLSKYDITVDMLIQLYGNEGLSKKFLDFLIEQWDKVEGFKSEEERQRFLSEEFLLKEVEKEAEGFLKLSQYGEYNIKFLILLALLLMKQEKTNRKDAYMFKQLLEALKEYKDIYKIVSIATHNSHKR